MLIGKLGKGGVTMAVWKRIKRAFSRYLERLGRENQAMFGNERPDCCTLNRKKAAQPPQKRS